MIRTLSLGCATLAVTGLLLLVAQFPFPLPDALQFGGRAALLLGVMGLVLVRLAAIFLGARRTVKLVANLLLLAFSTLLGLTACEMALRFAFRDVTTTVDFNSYFSARWRRDVRLNTLGFRDEEITAAKPADTYRIAVLGDSFAYGQGVPEEERFTELLSKRLNDGQCAARRFEVINLGRPGAETIDHVRILQEVALALDPDFVLLQWYENDVEGDNKSGRPRPMRLIPSSYLTSLLREHSVLHYMIQGRWTALQSSLGWLGSYDDYMRRRFTDPHSPDSQAASRAQAEFFSTTRVSDLPAGMILFPDPGGQRDLTFLHDRVLAQCVDEKVHCVDLQEAFDRVDDLRSLWASRLDRHPGGRAHALAADLLMETYAGLWREGCSNPGVATQDTAH